jgi:hypothetical protein
MKNLIVLIFISFSVIGYCQKPLSEYTIEELNLEKTEAVKVQDYTKAAIFKKAASLKKQLNEAVIAEEHDTAANLKEELNNLLNKDKSPPKGLNVSASNASERMQVGNYYPSLRTSSKELFSVDGKIISVNRVRGKIFLRSFSQDKLQLEKESFDEFPRNHDYNKTLIIRNRMFLFYSVYKKNKPILFVREINVNQCSFIGAGRMIFESNMPISSPMTIEDDRMPTPLDNFHFSLSPNEEKLLIICRVKRSTGDQYRLNDKFYVKVFDHNISELWVKEIELPYVRGKVENVDCKLDSKGNFCLSTFIYNDNSRSRFITYIDVNRETKQKVNYSVKLFKIKAFTGELEEMSLKLENSLAITSIKLLEFKNNKAICLGYFFSPYGTNNSIISSIGIFKYNGIIEGGKFDYFEIPVSVINKNKSKKKEIKHSTKKSKPNIPHIKLRTIHLSKDSSVILIGEQYQKVEIKYITPHPTRGITSGTKITYNYNDILIAKINKDDELSWVTKLAKRQALKRKRQTFSFVDNESNFDILYLDDGGNEDLDDVKEPIPFGRINSSWLMSYRINKLSGQAKRVSLFFVPKIKGSNMIKKDHDLDDIILGKDVIVVEAIKNEKRGPENEDVLIKVELK